MMLMIHTNAFLVIILVVLTGQLYQFRLTNNSDNYDTNNDNNAYSYKQDLSLKNTKQIIESFIDKLSPADNQPDGIVRHYKFDLTSAIQPNERELKLETYLNKVTDVKVVDKQEDITKDDLIVGKLKKNAANDVLTLKFEDVDFRMIYNMYINFYAKNTGSQPYLIRWLINVPNFNNETIHSRSPLHWIDESDNEVFYKLNVVNILAPPENFTRGSFQMNMKMFNKVNVSKAILFIKRDIPMMKMYKEVDMSNINFCSNINSSIPSSMHPAVRRQRLSCCINRFSVHPRQLRLNNLQQSSINLYYCTGDCFMHSHTRKSSNETKINRTFKAESRRRINDVSKKTCCSPSKYYGLQMIYMDNSSHIIPNVIAAECGCP